MHPYVHPIAKLSRFIIFVDILWCVSLADCLFTSDFPLFMHNPLLSPFVHESHCVYWLHQTSFLPASQCCPHLIIVFPFSILHVALFSPSLFHHVMLNGPPSIHPPRALQHLIQYFWCRNRGNVTPLCLFWCVLSFCTYILPLSCTTGIYCLPDTYPRLPRSWYLVAIC